MSIKKAAILFLVMAGLSNPVWAALVGENRLTPIVNDDPVKIEFEKVNLKYKPGYSSWWGGHKKAGFLTARGGFHSSYTLYAPGYDGVSFKSSFSLRARINAEGELVDDGRFGFYSSDPLFGFGSTTKCYWSKCYEKRNVGLVFGADLTDFGWSEDEGLLEFKTANLDGWACEQGWCSTGERFLFDVYGGIGDLLASISDQSRFYGKADGIAVIPVPAAVWLFATGLVGLAGTARRKRA